MNVETVQHPPKTKNKRLKHNINQSLITSFKAGLDHFFSLDTRDISIGEKLCFMAVLSLFELNDVVSKKDVVRYSKAKAPTTYENLKALQNKGFIESHRSNKFYSLSYISLTDKGTLFASRLRRILEGS